MTTRFKVSPVIGVIIMVAITVILAAVIAAFVLGVSGNIEKTRDITGVVLIKTVTGSGGTIQMVDEEKQDKAVLTVKDNAKFNSIQTFKRYTITATESGEVRDIKGPL
jgi:flagellin-like protein